MYKIMSKNQDGRYNVLDTVDNVVDCVPIELFEVFVDVGFSIEGVSVVNNKVVIADVPELYEDENEYNEEYEEDEYEDNNDSEQEYSEDEGDFEDDDFDEQEESEEDDEYSYEDEEDYEDGVINVENMFMYIPEGVRGIIKAYYKWYTVQIYKSFVQDIGLEVSINKARELTKLRGHHTWEFGGINDTEEFGGSCCELGHPIRYEYYAVNEIGDTIVFGEKCASDFFDISEDNMRKLTNIRKSMCEEILYIARSMYNGKSDINDLKLLYDVVDRIDDNGLYKNIMRGYLGIYFRKFVENGIPIPKSMVKSVRRMLNTPKSANEDGIYTNTKKGTYIDVMANLYPDRIEVFKEVISSKYKINRTIDTYLKFLFENRLDGMYAYDPVKKICHEEGSFKKAKVFEWNNRLRTIKYDLRCDKFTLEELDKIVNGLGNYKLCVDSARAGIEDSNVRRKIYNSLKQENKIAYDIFDDVVCGRYCFISDKDTKDFVIALSKFGTSSIIGDKGLPSNEQEPSEENSRYTLQERPDIRLIVDAIIENSKELTSVVRKKYPFAISIANTVKSFGWCSEKQLTYLRKGYELLK